MSIKKFATSAAVMTGLYRSQHGPALRPLRARTATKAAATDMALTNNGARATSTIMAARVTAMAMATSAATTVATSPRVFAIGLGVLAVGSILAHGR